MDVFAKSIEAKDDLRTFVWDFGQEHNQVCTVCLYEKKFITLTYMYICKYVYILKRKKYYIFNFKLQFCCNVNAI